ncbi:MAG TPA: hypothetical protein DCO75_09170 [Fibrobacteres bacterium]|nr:hypothetical protein [Fibrobacterota bacterium]
MDHSHLIAEKNPSYWVIKPAKKYDVDKQRRTFFSWSHVYYIIKSKKQAINPAIKNEYKIMVSRYVT